MSEKISIDFTVREGFGGQVINKNVKLSMDNRKLVSMALLSVLERLDPSVNELLEVIKINFSAPNSEDRPIMLCKAHISSPFSQKENIGTKDVLILMHGDSIEFDFEEIVEKITRTVERAIRKEISWAKDVISQWDRILTQ